MENIPIIYLKNRKIYNEKEGERISLDEALNQFNSDEKIYIFDSDGIKRDKPNLCMYPKLSEKLRIWVDSGPRDLGDVVDSVMAGASLITIRQNLYSNFDISSIKNITEREIYLNIDLVNKDIYKTDFSKFQDIDGIVTFIDDNQFDRDFRMKDLLKELCKQYKTYVAKTEDMPTAYLKKFGAAGLLLEASMLKKENY